VEVKIYTFLTTAFNEGQFSALRVCREHLFFKGQETSVSIQHCNTTEFVYV